MSLLRIEGLDDIASAQSARGMRTVLRPPTLSIGIDAGILALAGVSTISFVIATTPSSRCAMPDGSNSWFRRCPYSAPLFQVGPVHGLSLRRGLSVNSARTETACQAARTRAGPASPGLRAGYCLRLAKQ